MFRPTEITVLVRAQLTWRVTHDEQAGVYVGVCEPLNLNALGDTWGDFQDCANDAMDALFTDLFESGELEVFLAEHGWTLSQAPQRGVHRPSFDVPANIQIQPMREFAGTAGA